MNDDLDSRVKELTNHFDFDDVVIAGGMAVYLLTDSKRITSDMDLVALKKNLGRKGQAYSIKTGIGIDFTQVDSMFDSFDMSDLVQQSTRIHEYDSGEKVRYLGPEGVIVSKATSLCTSGDSNQPTTYGIKVLRDRDISDINNIIKNCEVSEDLIHEMLDRVLSLEEIDTKEFYEIFSQVLNDPDASLVMRKNAYGVAKVLSHPEIGSNQPITYDSLKREAESSQVLLFAENLNQKFLEIYQI